MKNWLACLLLFSFIEFILLSAGRFSLHSCKLYSLMMHFEQYLLLFILCFSAGSAATLLTCLAQLNRHFHSLMGSSVSQPWWPSSDWQWSFTAFKKFKCINYSTSLDHWQITFGRSQLGMLAYFFSSLLAKKYFSF